MKLGVEKTYWQAHTNR